MAQPNEVAKMVNIYKKLFIILVSVTALGILLTAIHMPFWLTFALGLVIMLYKSKIVLDSFAHLLTGKNLLIMTFVLTVVFFLALLLLPWLNHEDRIVGTEDISKQLQMEHKSAEGNHGGH